MYRNIVLSVLASASLAFFVSGCGDSRGKRDAEELKGALNQQAKEINALHKQLAENVNEMKQIKELLAIKNDVDQRKRFVEAAVMLATQGPESISNQAIGILGSLGGQDAETALLDILENGTSQNRYHSVLDAIERLNSKKLSEIILNFLTSGNEQEVNAAIGALQNRSMRKSLNIDVSILEKLLKKYPDNDYNSNRHYRNVLTGAIIRADQDKGIDLLCKELISANQPNKKRELLYQISNNNIALSIKSFTRILDAVGEIDSRNTETLQALLQLTARASDWRLTDKVLSWYEIAANDNNLSGSYIEALARLSDPKGAPVFLELCQTKTPSRRGNYSHYLNNYPGIEKDGKDNYRLADDEKMKKLLAAREKRIEELNKLDAD